MSTTIRILKDGYWDRTSVVSREDGILRVRKECRNTPRPGPWSHQALRNEIAYLRSLPRSVRIYFPPLLDSWDGDSPGYEIPFFGERRDVAQLLLDGCLDAGEATSIQQTLTEVILRGLHSGPQQDGVFFARHLEEVLEAAITELARDPTFQEIAESPGVRINSRASVPGLRSALEATRKAGILSRLSTYPSVQLHGDLILENILWPGLMLIDPVSVTGLTHGPPLFDLVKYESYASGELYAIRKKLVTAAPDPSGGYSYEVPWGCDELSPFRRIDLHSLFRAEYLSLQGPIDRQLYHLLDAYFSLVMARNTSGAEQFARVLKGCQCLAAAAHEGP